MSLGLGQDPGAASPWQGPSPAAGVSWGGAARSSLSDSPERERRPQGVTSVWGPMCYSPPLSVPMQRGLEILGQGTSLTPPLFLMVFPKERAASWAAHGGCRRGAMGFGCWDLLLLVVAFGAAINKAHGGGEVSPRKELPWWWWRIPG